MVFDVVLIITAAKGKEARGEELIAEQVAVIEKNEPGMLYDRCYRRINSEGESEYVIIQRYKDEEAYNAHFHTEHWKRLPKIIEDEKLMARPMVYMKLEPMNCGFER